MTRRGWRCWVGWHSPIPMPSMGPNAGRCRDCGQVGALDAEGYLHVGTVPAWRRDLLMPAPVVEILVLLEKDGRVHWCIEQPETPDHAAKCVDALLSAGLEMAKKHNLTIRLPRGWKSREEAA